MPIALSLLLSFISPLTTLLFFLNCSGEIGETLLWTLPLLVLMLADWQSPEISDNKVPSLANHFYDTALYILALLQFINIGLMLQYVSQLPWHSTTDIISSLVALVVIRFLVGTSSGCSGIIVAHELIHRASGRIRLLGQLLLCSVCYGHFAIAHREGHHRHVGNNQDITTARRGESFNTYWRRVISAHFIYAWNYEAQRLQSRPRFYPTIFYNRVLQIVVFESLLLLSFTLFFGWLAGLMFLYQAYVAVRILEAVNYFQHWGLQGNETDKTLGWVNDSLITRQVFIGLSQHIHHHKNASKHFQQLKYSDQGPKMPYGYFVMNLWVKLNNKSYQKMAVRQLTDFNQCRT